ncbi:histone methyltransferase set2 [Friedmanniomyces endolithicus]|uniref:Histone-lysine N-methyltransferase, H3 lysine-36 specific n=1 Tax=Friedmanniomyces endolithicus TaxID=329885 RepID=A0AAN6K3Z2_9PEZI|nr:histone methyltransferase set2 [Friedmanniomyces endolithicus]KAK0954795.1 histone methyltransferase set2 [Friedmanniomyces endolithicus]KAK0991001.1 histone methyltransferase set2 [Friedmanniomyces endolithicus]KAK1029548.1 histone methyltransferase set2 [Friedmanniomyces endolithicus]
MAEDGGADKQEAVESLRGMHLKEELSEEDADMDTIAVAGSTKSEGFASASDTGTGNATPTNTKRQSRSPVKVGSMARSPALTNGHEETLGGGVTLKLEPGKPPKLARTTSTKVIRRPPPLFSDYEDKTAEATSVFTVIPECTYANKHLGTTETALECDCAEEWDVATHTNNACDEDSDCINRATKMECAADCGCRAACQNQRFLRKQFADVGVIKTEKKGYGLRANTDLKPNDFIFEYIGEVIGENVFRRRMQQYDEEGIKHFYFMSLTKGEFVDATKRGNLGRFCNHSCNPNCYVDKWVVGDKLRMGIFAERKVQAGEELVFNYNVDRYGAEPQPCYCGEPNCTGYIGGKTQTERATKLSNVMIEALGIDDADAWDTAVAKKPRKKKAGEDDEEYVNNVEPRGLDEDGVTKVMSSLMQCKEKWIAVKLLTRVQRADDEKVRNRVVRMHGYRILKTALSNFIDDVNLCLQILDILNKLPRLTRNKIQDSKIEEAVMQLKDNADERVSSQANALLDGWSKLEVGYRIPRMKRDPNAIASTRKVERPDRRDGERRRSRSRSRTKSPERIAAPTGPRGNVPSRGPGFFAGQRPPPRFRPPPPPGALPPGWFEAIANNGTTYFYNAAGTTTWQKPTMPATNAPPPPPPKAVSDQQMLQDLIKNIVSTRTDPVRQPLTTNAPVETPKKERKEDKWRSLPEDKQKKMYEGTLQPHIMHVVGKYKHKLAKDDLKRWAKEFAKKMVDADFKKGRVEDPSKISDKQAKSVKKHAQEFFDKAVKKKVESEKRKAEKKASKQENGSHTPVGTPPATAGSPMDKDEEDITLSDDEADEPLAAPVDANGSPSMLKRRAESIVDDNDEDDTFTKRQRTESEPAQPPPPPPPPPPPAEGSMQIDDAALAPGEDVSGSFTHEAIVAVYEATVAGASAGDDDFSFKGAASASRPGSRPGSAQMDRDFDGSTVLQTATPPTTGSPDHDEVEKARLRQSFAGMNPERMRQLGMLDGARG